MNPRSRPHAPLTRIAYVLALLALAQPLLATVLPEANGWRPDHAHVQLAGSPASAHAHPYDHPAEERAASTSADVGFLAPDADGSVAVLPSPAALSVPDALRSAPRPAAILPADAPIEADLPPPRV